MQDETYNKLILHPKVQTFVRQLLEEGVPLSAIMTNDIDHCPDPVVYVTVPYGNENGGSWREYRRLSVIDAVRAAAWYRNAVQA